MYRCSWENGELVYDERQQQKRKRNTYLVKDPSSWVEVKLTKCAHLARLAE